VAVLSVDICSVGVFSVSVLGVGVCGGSVFGVGLSSIQFPPQALVRPLFVASPRARFDY
jgi:hypothetical protein